MIDLTMFFASLSSNNNGCQRIFQYIHPHLAWIALILFYFYQKKLKLIAFKSNYTLDFLTDNDLKEYGLNGNKVANMNMKSFIFIETVEG